VHRKRPSKPVTGSRPEASHPAVRLRSGIGSPAEPAPPAELRLRLPDGTSTFVRTWPAHRAGRGSILIVHGLGEHSGRYEHVAQRLAAVGLEVRAYDLRGHGHTDGARGSIPRDDALLDDLRCVFDDLAGDGAPPLLLGHSLGGTIAAAGTAGGWVAPRALVLSSPALALHVGAARAAVLRAARRLVPDRQFPNELPVDRLSHERAVVDAYRSDELVHDRITPRLYGFLADAGAAVRRGAARLSVPTLLLVAGDDALVDSRGSRELAAALAPGVGTARFYDGLYHEVFNEREPDRARVLGDLTAWLDQRLSEPARGASPRGRS
jgi:alpha-beta hydrolase superfamily lysophospholipase